MAALGSSGGPASGGTMAQADQSRRVTARSREKGLLVFCFAGEGAGLLGLLLLLSKDAAAAVTQGCQQVPS